MNFIHIIINLYSYVYFNKIVIFMVVFCFILQFVVGVWKTNYVLETLVSGLQARVLGLFLGEEEQLSAQAEETALF